MSDRYFYVLHLNDLFVEVSEDTLNAILKDIRSQGIIESKRVNRFNPHVSDIFVNDPDFGNAVIAYQFWCD